MVFLTELPFIGPYRINITKPVIGRFVGMGIALPFVPIILTIKPVIDRFAWHGIIIFHVIRNICFKAFHDVLTRLLVLIYVHLLRN